MSKYEIITLFVLPVLSGFLGAFILWLIQQRYLNSKEQLKESNQKLLKSKNSERIVTSDFFHDFGLGTSIEHMKSALGIPNKYRRTDYPVFSEEEIKTNSYFYEFSNAYIKVTSKDNEVIDTITVISNDNSIDIGIYPFPCESDSNILGELKVCPELVENSNHTYIQTRWDSSFALEFYTGSPLYEHYTYFGFSDKSSQYHDTKAPDLFIGESINGICISSSENEVYFIYENEIR